MAERWFSDQELAEMARPTMERAIEPLDRGDTDGARALCEEMKKEGRYVGSARDSLQRGDARLDRHPQGARDACPRAGWRDGPDPARPLRRAHGAGRRRRLPALPGGRVHQRNGPQGRRRVRPVDAMTQARSRSSTYRWSARRALEHPMSGLATCAKRADNSDSCR